MPTLHPAVRETLARRLTDLQRMVVGAKAVADERHQAFEDARAEYARLANEKRAIQEQLQEDATNQVAASPYAGHPDQATPAGAADYAGTDEASPDAAYAREAAERRTERVTGALDAARPAQRAEHGDGATPAERATVYPEGEVPPAAARAEVQAATSDA